MPTKIRNKVNVEITANMRISLEIKLKDDINGMKHSITLSSIVEDFTDDGCLIIQMPIHQGYHYPLPRDNPILMHFFMDSEIYGLPVHFEERIERGGLIFARLRQIGRIKLHQQRDCYRLPCSLPVTVERLWLREREIYTERQPTEGQIMNISDGGMLFATNENIERDEKITLTFDICQSETIEGMALRTERIEDGKYLFKVAVRFRNKDKAQKRRLYRFIVEKQLEEIRRWTQDIKPLYPPGNECKEERDSNE